MSGAGPGAVVDTSEPQRGPPDAAERFTAPKAEAALEEWGRRLAERTSKLGRHPYI